jgi:hypothetical protein
MRQVANHLIAGRAKDFLLAATRTVQELPIDV